MVRLFLRLPHAHTRPEATASKIGASSFARRQGSTRARGPRGNLSGLETFQCADSFLQRRVRVEEPVDPRSESALALER